jgi:hypothetical protein
MSTELTTANPFGNRVGLQTSEAQSTAMSGVVQTRAVTEVQAAVCMAKQFPRDPIAATERILIACQRESLASQAEYTYPRGGTQVTGPSIRLAEALAAGWGNIDCGIVEVGRNAEESTVLAYAWDLETNFRSTKTFTVPHIRDKKGGGVKLTESRDIYENIANNGARRLRACILGVIPGDIVDAAVDQCRKTLKVTADVSPENLKKLADAFSKFGVTKEMIERRIQRRFDAMQPGQLVDLRRIYNSIKDGMSSAPEYFEMTEPEKPKSTGAKIDEALGINGKAGKQSLGNSASTPTAPADPPTTKEKDWEKNLPPFPETTEREPGEEG